MDIKKILIVIEPDSANRNLKYCLNFFTFQIEEPVYFVAIRKEDYVKTADYYAPCLASKFCKISFNIWNEKNRVLTRSIIIERLIAKLTDMLRSEKAQSSGVNDDGATGNSVNKLLFRSPFKILDKKNKVLNRSIIIEHFIVKSVDRIHSFRSLVNNVLLRKPISFQLFGGLHPQLL